MKNALRGFVAVIIIALIGAVWWQSQLIQSLEEAAAKNAAEKQALDQRAAATEKALVEANKTLAESTKKLSELEKAQALAAATPAPRPFSPGTSATARDPFAASMAALDNPALMKVMAAGLKGGLDQRYSALFRKLKLSPSELDKFKDLITDKSIAGLDVIRSAQTQGLDMGKNGAEVAKLMGTVQTELEDNIHSLLGDDKFRLYQDFNQNMSSYALFDQVERRLSYTNAPLQEGQSDALLRVLINNTQPSPMERASTGPGAAMNSFAQGMAGANPIVAAMSQRVINDATITAAQNVLAEPQVEALRQLQTEQKAQLNQLQGLRNLGTPPDSLPQHRLRRRLRPLCPAAVDRAGKPRLSSERSDAHRAAHAASLCRDHIGVSALASAPCSPAGSPARAIASRSWAPIRRITWQTFSRTVGSVAATSQPRLSPSSHVSSRMIF